MKGLFILTFLIIANLVTACSPSPDLAATPVPTEQGWWSIGAKLGNSNATPTSSGDLVLPPGMPGVALTDSTPKPASGRRWLQLQPGTPMFVKNFSHPDLDCSWSGVGGQVFGEDSWPVSDLKVELGGGLAGKTYSKVVQTGSAQKWGPGGFEFTLGDRPFESLAVLWLQFYDAQGAPVSERVYFNTSADCFRNAVMINMVEVNLSDTYHCFLPTIGKGSTGE